MISLFFEGFILGLGAAIPIGPINILIMSEALRSYKRALFIGLGAMSADISYLSVILYGVSNYLKNDILLDSLSLFGGLFLIYLAYLIFKDRDQKVLKVKQVKAYGLFTYYLKGYLLTLLNPYTILFWLSVTTYSTNRESIYIVIYGLITAITLWIALMPYLVHKQKHLISNKISSMIAIGSSLIFLFFGLSLIYKVSI